jgi:AcrR family transcriptional regulator
MATVTAKRTGAKTREEILRVALDLFTEKGFEGTSIRDIAEAVGMQKSSLYYHFANKDDIVASLMRDRVDEVTQLLAWVRQQPRTAGLVQATALRWLERTTPERLSGMRLAQTNQPVMRRMAGTAADMGEQFERVFDELLDPTATPATRLHLRVVFDTVNAALLASRGSDFSDRDVLTVARLLVMELT